jgi:hypothetical protein
MFRPLLAIIRRQIQHYHYHHQPLTFPPWWVYCSICFSILIHSPVSTPIASMSSIFLSLLYIFSHLVSQIIIYLAFFLSMWNACSDHYVHLSTCSRQLENHCMNYHETLYWVVLQTCHILPILVKTGQK